jgi:hypothetical protein
MEGHFFADRLAGTGKAFHVRFFTQGRTIGL